MSGGHAACTRLPTAKTDQSQSPSARSFCGSPVIQSPTGSRRPTSTSDFQQRPGSSSGISVQRSGRSRGDGRASSACSGQPSRPRSKDRENAGNTQPSSITGAGVALTLIEALSPVVLLSRVIIFTYSAALMPALASAREHRSIEVKHAFQRLYPCPSTGRTTGTCPGYVKDHIPPFACGGPDAVSNLQWQTIRDAG
jgi:hypothetical protein